MAKNVRLNLTENERMAQKIVGLEQEHSSFNMAEHDINNVLKKEKAIRFNEELASVADKFENAKEKLEQNADRFGEDISKIEIKPMFGHVLIKPLEQNPFQRVKIQSGIIVDAGILTPHASLNPNTGNMEEEKEYIKTAVVQEIGPDVKYLREGDVVFYQEPSACPIPFFKQGFFVINENRVLSVVNEGLDSRFKEVKENGRD